jgi:exosome complex component RRP41
MKEKIQLLKNGVRLDGRKLDELRPIKAELGVISSADGSALFELGNTRVIAGVYGPRELHPQHLQDQEKAVLNVRYSMAPFSTKERSRPGPNRRSIEISLVIRKVFESVIFLEEFPKSVIDVYIEVIEANASTRVAGLNAASLALAEAGIPMRGLVAACSAGKIDGKIALDIAGEEDSYGDADIPVAILFPQKEIALLQLDGDVTPKELEEALNLAEKGCEKIFEVQKKVLKSKYGVKYAED